MGKIYPVKNHEGYGVDKEGNIYTYWVNKSKHGILKSNIPKKLICSKTLNGHKFVTFRGGKKKYVHRVIYETFKGEIPPGLVVRHLNDIPSDNRIENLEVGTQKENAADCKRNGKTVVGRGRWNGKFSDEDIKKIRSLKGKKTNTELAKVYKCDPSTISNIQRRFTWAHVV